MRRRESRVVASTQDSLAAIVERPATRTGKGTDHASGQLVQTAFHGTRVDGLGMIDPGGTEAGVDLFGLAS